MNLTQIIGVNILTILTFICGYVLGYIMNKEEPLKEISKGFKKVVIRGRVGAVKRPTQQQIEERTDPFQKRIKEGKDAMAKTLSKLLKEE